MSCSKFVDVASLAALLVKENLRLAQENKLLRQVKVARAALEAIITPTLLIWNDFYKEKNSILLKQRSFVHLSMWLLRRLRPNHNITYVPRLLPINEKSTAVLLVIEKFDKKLGQAEEKMRRMDFEKLSKTRELNLENATIKELEAEVRVLEERIPKATEVKQMSISLKEEWVPVKETLETDMDDCVYQINALIRETYIDYADTKVWF